MVSQGRKSRFDLRVWILVVDLTPLDGSTPLSIRAACISLNGLLKEFRRCEVWGHGGLGSGSERSCMTSKGNGEQNTFYAYRLFSNLIEI